MFPDTLMLTRYKGENGTFYLYDEHVDQAPGLDGIISSKGVREPNGSRMPSVVEVDGHRYIVKPERSPTNPYFRKHPKSLPSHGNVSAREVSIARALRENVSFKDEDIDVTFEEPLGYVEKEDGTRASLFVYEGGITLFSSEVHQKIHDLIRSSGNTFRELGVRSSFIYRLFRPDLVVGSLLLHNGIYHNEHDAVKVTSSGSYFVFDFELVKILDEPGLDQLERKLVETTHDFRALPRELRGHFPALDKVDQFADQVGEPWVAEVVREKAALRERQIRTIVGENFPHGYEPGPAFDLMRQIDTMNPQDIIRK